MITGERRDGKLSRGVREEDDETGPEPRAPRRRPTSLDGEGLETDTADHGEATLKPARETRRPVRCLPTVNTTVHRASPLPNHPPVARDVQFWRDRLDIKVPITLDTIVLTAEQIAAYDLPPAPDTGAVELDALEALHPGALGDIVTEAAERFIDYDLADRFAEARREAEEAAADQLADHMADVLAERDRLRDDIAEALEPFRDRLDTLTDEIEEALGPFRDRLDELHDGADEALDTFDPELPDRPSSDPGDADEDVLYDSQRHWLEQVDHYQAHRSPNEEP